MALISFPITPESIKNKVYAVGPQVAISGGFKSEVGYTVPSNRKGLINLHFSGVVVEQGSGGANIFVGTYPFSVTDFLKPGDVVYAGYSYVINVPATASMTWFYQLNGVTIFTETYNFGVPISSQARDFGVSTTIQVLELDK